MLREGKSLSAYLSSISFLNIREIEALAQTILSKDEIIYFDQTINEKRRHSYLVGRLAAKLAISRYMNNNFFFDFKKPAAEELLISLKDISISMGCFGQPMVDMANPRCLDISISHCDDHVAALAFPRWHPMALDIENIQPSNADAILTQITPSERLIIDNSLLQKDVGATLIWTAKEALSKVLKCGLTVPLEVLEISNIETISHSSLRIYYRHFSQYKSISWVISANRILSIVLPKKTNIEEPFPL